MTLFSSACLFQLGSLPEHTEQPQSKSKEEQAKADSLYNLTKLYMWATIVGVLVALSGVAALIAQTIITRRSSQQELRAYVVQELGNISNVANPIQAFRGEAITPTGAEISNPAVGPVAYIQIKNTGQTPAFEVRHWGDICFREHPLLSELPLPAPAEIESIPSFVLDPGIISTKRRYIGQPLSPTQIADLRVAKAAVYVYGVIHYTDAFKVKRITKYRFKHNILTGPLGVTTDLTFCENGNEV